MLSDGPALGTDPRTQRLHLAHAAAYLHHVPPATLAAAHGEGLLALLSGLFGRGHGGGGGLGSGVCLLDGSRPQANSDPGAAIRQRVNGNEAALALGLPHGLLWPTGDRGPGFGATGKPVRSG